MNDKLVVRVLYGLIIAALAIVMIFAWVSGMFKVTSIGDILITLVGIATIVMLTVRMIIGC